MKPTEEVTADLSFNSQSAAGNSTSTGCFSLNVSVTPEIEHAMNYALFATDYLVYHASQNFWTAHSGERIAVGTYNVLL